MSVQKICALCIACSGAMALVWGIAEFMVFIYTGGTNALLSPVDSLFWPLYGIIALLMAWGGAVWYDNAS